MAVIEQEFPIVGAVEVVLEGRGVIELVQGETEMLVIRTEDWLIPKLKTDVNNGRLALGFRSFFDQLLQVGHPSIFYRVTVRDPRVLSIAGAGSLRAETLESERLRMAISGSGKMEIGAIHTSELEVSIAGSGQVRSDVQAQSVKVSIPGSGRADLSGSVQQADLKISGSGRVLGEELSCQSAQARITGSGSVELAVSEKLDVSISGSGSVRYSGTPALSTRITGSGRVVAAQGVPNP